ncbi:MAG TPA: pyrimidine 5'-nucleotidase [Anaerolineales bacterium]|nr:pyrimidine 5'-nucleotidase [Anaerolineales bacterium]
MKTRLIFFDLDDTLYRRETGVWQAIRGRIEGYMHERLHIPRSRVPSLRADYLATYGSSLRGLMENYQVDPDDYLLYVHDVPIEALLRPSANLAKMLSALPQAKWVFTNASLAHARRVLAALGSSQFFAGIVDIKSMGYTNKPEEAAYRLALKAAGEDDPAGALFVDDQGVNLEPAKRLGAATVLVGTREPHPAADHSILAVELLPQVISGLVE